MKNFRQSIDMIEAIRRELNKGYSFIPLVGSGISAASGILMGEEFTNFLAWVSYRVIADTDEQKERWDLRSKGWPRYPNSSEVQQARSWIYKKFKEICGELQYFPYPKGNHDADYENFPFVQSVLSVDLPEVPGATPNHSLFASSHMHTSSNGVSSSFARPLVPQVIKHDDYFGDDDQIRRSLALLAKDVTPRDMAGNSSMSTTSTAYAIQRGIRSLYDWKATLQFLSEAVVGVENHLSIGPVTQWLIDSFNIHITRGKKGNLGHKMLCHLTQPMRVSTILTTNFDSLLQGTLKELKHPFEILTVGINGSLPDPSTVRAQDSIIKLHGGMLDTRADFTLNETPAIEEKERFAGYFDDAKANCKTIPSHMMAIGFSGRDNRIVQFIKFVLEKNRTTKIFWICHNENDRKRVQNLFGEKQFRCRIFTYVTPRPDLLLYELFQELTFSLPGGGFAYQFSHRIPHGDSDPSREVLHTASAKQISNYLRQLRPGNFNETRKEIVFETEKEIVLYDKNFNWEAGHVVIKNDVRKFSIISSGGEEEYSYNARVIKWRDGTVDVVVIPRANWTAESKNNRFPALVCESSSSAAKIFKQVFEDLNRDSSCIWIELQDYTRPSFVLNDILKTISSKLGLFQLEHVLLSPAWLDVDEHDGKKEKLPKLQSHVKSLCKDYFKIDNTDWVIFLYGRNLPGGCAGWDDLNWDTKGVKEIQEMEMVLQLLINLGFRVVYLPMSKARYEHFERCNKQNRGTRDKLEKKWKEAGGELIKDVEEINKTQNYLDAINEPNGEIKSSDGKNLEIEYKNKNSKSEDQKIRRALAKVFQIKPTPKSQEIKAKIVEGVKQYESQYWSNILEKCKVPFSIGSRDIHIGELSDSKLNPGTVAKNVNLSHFIEEADRIDSEEEQKLKKKFIFGASLFRQSRHTSAFYCEGVFPCPKRFNGDQHDNDLARSLKVGKWIKTLRENKIFYYKPGGYAWIYRDVRQSLQSKLQVEAFERNGLQFLGQWRSRAHYYIGAWYAKAFFATGHSMPLTEALYHYLKSIQYARYSKSENSKSIQPEAYQLCRFRLSLLGMVNLIRIAMPWIKFWMHNQEGNPLFVDEELKVLQNETKKHGQTDFEKFIINLNHEPKIRFAGKDLELYRKSNKKLMINRCVLLIAAELEYFKEKLGSPDEDITEKITELATKIVRYEHFNDDETKVDSVELDPIVSDEVAKKLRTSSKDEDKKKDENKTTVVKLWYKYTSLFDLLELLRDDLSWVARYLKQEASSRSEAVYPEDGLPIDPPKTGQESASEPRLIEIDYEIVDPADNGTAFVKVIDGVSDKIRIGVAIKEFIDSTAPLEGAVKKLAGFEEILWRLRERTENEKCRDSNSIFELAFVFMKRAKLQRLHEQLAKTDVKFSERKSTRSFVLCEAICYLGLRLVREIHPAYLEFGIHAQVRLLTLNGLALCYLHRFYEGNRKLREADAIISKAGHFADKVNHGIVYLRQAESLLVEAELRRSQLKKLGEFSANNEIEIDDIFKYPNKEVFPSYLRELITSNKSNRSTSKEHLLDQLDILEQLRKVEILDIESLVKRHFAAISDAARCLEKAEVMLSGISHSSRWWGRLITLKLRAFSSHWLQDYFDTKQKEKYCFDTLLFRRKIDHAEYVQRLADQAMLIFVDDEFRKIRTFHYLNEALVVIANRTTFSANVSQLDLDAAGREIDKKMYNFWTERIESPEKNIAIEGHYRSAILAEIRPVDPSSMVSAHRTAC